MYRLPQLEMHSHGRGPWTLREKPGLGSWSSTRTETATTFNIDLPEGQLTVVLATKTEVQTMQFYRMIEQATGKKFLHIAQAAGHTDTRYPIEAIVHPCPMYHKGKLRATRVEDFYVACKETARQGQAVLIHCNQSFHRGPLLLLAILVLAGYDKDESLSIISKKRHIYPGNFLPVEDWPQAERDGETDTFNATAYDEVLLKYI